MVTAILLSGGIGSRLGGNIPKQYIAVKGRRIVDYCLETILSCSRVNHVRIVAAEEWQESIMHSLREMSGSDRFVGFSRPGKTRQLSIYSALQDMVTAEEQEGYVLICDAARPKMTTGDLEGLIAAAEGHEGVLPVLYMKDTVYLTDEAGKVSSLLPRSQVVAGQAPELYSYRQYRRANETLIADGRMEAINGAAEPAVLAGMDIVTIPGNEDNYKITTEADLRRFCIEMGEEPDRED